MNIENEYEIVPSPAPVSSEQARTYEEFIRETNETSKTYEVNGIHYYLRNETDPSPVKKIMNDHKIICGDSLKILTKIKSG